MFRIKVGGNILRIAENIFNYAKGNITYSSAVEGMETAPKIEYGVAEPHPEREEPMDLAVVEFRPIVEGPEGVKYESQFGFDWLRIDDSPMGNIETPYFEILTDKRNETGYYNVRDGGADFERYKNKKEQYTALKKEYARHPIRFREEKEETEGNENDQKYYYVPWLTIYPKDYIDSLPENEGLDNPVHEVYLNMIIEINQDLDAWELDYNSTYFNVKLIKNKKILKKEDSQSFSVTYPKKSVELETSKCDKKYSEVILKITCLKGFDKEQEISVYAYPKGSHEKTKAEKDNLKALAGKIKVLPNSLQYRKKLKIFAVEVKTDVVDDIPQKGEVREEESKFLSRFLHQALIEVEIEKIELDLTEDKKFKIEIKDDDSVKEQLANKENEISDYFEDNLDKGFLNIKGQVKRQLVNKENEIFDHLEDKLVSYYFKEPADPCKKSYFEDKLVIFFLELSNVDSVNATAGETRGKYYVIKNGTTTDKGEAVDYYYLEDYKKKIILYNTPPIQTLVHEVGHALGLNHTFYPDQEKQSETIMLDGLIPNNNYKYFFNLKSTLNLMDYNVRVFSWKWQWCIIRKRI